MAESPVGWNATCAGCPDAATLRAFLEERLDGTTHGAVLDHVAGCAACDAALAAMSLSDAVAPLAGAGAYPPDPEATAFAARLAASAPPRRPLPRVAPNIPGLTGLEPVGRGGMGVVYRGRDVATDAEVAVKVLWSVGGLTDAAQARARSEVETLARIDDPGIVRVLRAGRCDGGPLEPDGVPYIVMEWIDGETLQQRVGKRALGVREAAKLIRDLGRILARVHSLGIVHRDIKPANVFLIPGRRAGEQPMPKLVDFGLARDESGDGWSIGAREIAGTPGYMAPEQSRGDGELGPVGPAADVHGLGATLFFLLVGRPPLDRLAGDAGSTLTPALDWRTEQPVRVPVDLRTIVEKCLRTSPLRRYSSAGEVADDLDRFLDGLPIRARQASVGERLVTWTRRHPGWGVAATLALLSLGLGGVGAWLHTVRLARANLVANDARETAQAALEQLTGGWVQGRIARGPALDAADRAYLGAVREMYRSWTLAGDPLGALRFRATGLSQIARILAVLEEHDQALAAYGEALAALDEYESRGGDNAAVTMLRLELLRDRAQLARDAGPAARPEELAGWYRMLLDDPAARRARTGAERAIVADARLGLAIAALDWSLPEERRGEWKEPLAAVDAALDELAALDRAEPADPAAAVGHVDGLIAAATLTERATGHRIARDRLRRAVDRADRALERFPSTADRERFSRLRLMALATLCDLELAAGEPRASLDLARELIAATRGAAEADGFHRGEHVEAVIREAWANLRLGQQGESVEPLAAAVEAAARAVAEEPAVFAHAGRLAKVLQCQSFILDATGSKAEAASAARRIAAVLLPWRDSAARNAWAADAIAGAIVRSGQLRTEAGDHRGAIDDYRKLLAIVPAEQRAGAARQLLAAGRAAGRRDVVWEATKAVLRHDAELQGKILGTLGVGSATGAPAPTPPSGGQ